MNPSKLLNSIGLGFKSLLLHKLRSGLTVMGIIFGVCSVITMLAVGEGASQEAQQRIKTLGSNNIILESKKPSEKDQERVDNVDVLAYGLTYLDWRRISASIKGVKEIVPLRMTQETCFFRNHKTTCKLVGTHASYVNVKSIKMRKGRFLCPLDSKFMRKVCVLTPRMAALMFPYENPLEHKVKLKGALFQVVGITEEKLADENQGAKEVYIPLETMRNRFGINIVKMTMGGFSAEAVELHSLILQMENAKAVVQGEGQVARLLEYAHTKSDYKITVPLQLLKDAEDTKRMFNIVLGSIAAISLLVGGIGIMNIMLATVTERTREIGLRRALGAKKRDIISQFMIEAVLLTVCGGLAGIVLGVLAPVMISKLTGVMAVVSLQSIVLAFVVSSMTGIVFGIYPAAKSARLDPIEALRNE
jgi:putative ABC transport system permease protein